MRVLSALVIVISIMVYGCARKVATPSFKESMDAYDKDFNTVWDACLKAVEDQTIDKADKNLKQIVTVPGSGNVALGIGGNTVKYTTIKISDTRPYRVRVRVLMTHKTPTMGGPLGLTTSTEDYSVLEDEKRLLEKIDTALK